MTNDALTEDAYKRYAAAREAMFVLEFTFMSCAVHNTARSKGWHKTERSDGDYIALMHSELSEALEALRKDNPPSEKVPAFSEAEEELADLVIRAMDYSVARGFRLAEAIVAKAEYNKTRPHRHGGKKF